MEAECMMPRGDDPMKSDAITAVCMAAWRGVRLEASLWAMGFDDAKVCAVNDGFILTIGGAPFAEFKAGHPVDAMDGLVSMVRKKFTSELPEA